MSFMMRTVLLAMLPGMLVYVWLAGPYFIVHTVLAVAVAVSAEAVCLRCRGWPWRPALADCSVLVTAMLLAVCINSGASWVVPVVAALVAVVVGKHLFGGLSCNLFNPAMVGYVFVLLCFPDELSSGFAGADSISSATPLGYMQTELAGMGMLGELVNRTDFTATRPGLWQIAAGAWLVGGLFLIYRRVIDWRVPVSLLAVLTVCSLLFYGYDSQQYLSPWWHWVLGGTMIGAFFIATDPVSSAVTPAGRLLYGGGIGLLIWAIRSFSSLPDSVASAVLLMNAVAPALDRPFLRRR